MNMDDVLRFMCDEITKSKRALKELGMSDR